MLSLEFARVGGFIRVHTCRVFYWSPEMLKELQKGTNEESRPRFDSNASDMEIIKEATSGRRFR